MEAIKAKLAVWTKDKGLIKAFSILLGTLLILLICLCISINMRTNIHRKYSATMHQLQEETYQNLISMTQLFARIDDPTVDVRYKLIPSLREDYAAVSALNSILMQGYGAKHAVLSAEQITAFDAAFELYSQAYRTDSATGLAQADMAACIEEIQAMIDLRYPSEDSAMKDVVIIDASSGQVQQQ